MMHDTESVVVLADLARRYVEHVERAYDQMAKGKQGRTARRETAIWARRSYNDAMVKLALQPRPPKW